MKRSFEWKFTVVAILLVVALAPTQGLLGQVQAGRIVGTVTDPNKAVVPNAKVVITNTGTNQAQNLTTNSAGEFVLTPAEPGYLQCGDQRQWFRHVGSQGSASTGGAMCPRRRGTQIGDIATRVEVTAAVPLLN